MILKHRLLEKYDEYTFKIPVSSRDKVLVMAGEKVETGAEMFFRKGNYVKHSFFLPDRSTAGTVRAGAGWSCRDQAAGVAVVAQNLDRVLAAVDGHGVASANGLHGIQASAFFVILGRVLGFQTGAFLHHENLFAILEQIAGGPADLTAKAGVFKLEGVVLVEAVYGEVQGGGHLLVLVWCCDGSIIT